MNGINFVPGCSGKTKIKAITGDIRDFQEVLDAVDGVDAVIHTAAMIDVTLIPDYKTMEDINVRGKRPLFG